MAVTMGTWAAAEGMFYRVVGPTNSQITGFSADGTLTFTNAVAGGDYRVQTTGDPTTVESNWVDHAHVHSAGLSTALRVFDPAPPSDMVLVPAGSFAMGDNFEEGSPNELPVHSVTTDAFYMDRYEVRKELWDEVAAWAATNDYDIVPGLGLAKGATHPVHMVSWYKCVRWANARSEREGLTPCYTVGGEVYRQGDQTPVCNWNANGYRLPTEAEWEKAARGGPAGHRFAWSDSDLIQHTRTTYFSSSHSRPAYDTSATTGYHPDYAYGVYPYTAPVGTFAANGYGLHEMSGNIQEWCWDWFEMYPSSSQSNPSGPPTGDVRITRGGHSRSTAVLARAAARNGFTPSTQRSDTGFRLVRRAE